MPPKWMSDPQSLLRMQRKNLMKIWQEGKVWIAMPLPPHASALQILKITSLTSVILSASRKISIRYSLTCRWFLHPSLKIRPLQALDLALLMKSLKARNHSLQSFNSLKILPRSMMVSACQPTLAFAKEKMLSSSIVLIHTHSLYQSKKLSTRLPTRVAGAISARSFITNVSK